MERRQKYRFFGIFSKNLNNMTVEEQIERFRTGFPTLDIISPATPVKGIKVLDDAQADAAAAYAETSHVAGRCKFVPASGAASRMFKEIFAGLDAPNEAVKKLQDNIKSFAFYSPEVFDGKNAAAALLLEEGLGYGSKPKGVLKFHRYADGECRTSFAEHLVEGQDYMRNPDGGVRIIFTISPEHQPLFEAAFADVREKYEKRYGVRYDISFTYQDKATDTVAVDMDNNLFLKEDGTVLRRPAGHGALIYNLNGVEEELVSIKNIDNVANERLLPVTSRYKKVLMGVALGLRDRIFGYLEALDAAPNEALLSEITFFLKNELCVEMPSCTASAPMKERVEALRAKLNRPIRVCGMVRNEGEPGGGPFIVRAADGSTSLQILESVQLDRKYPEATHFNPVDLVCCLRNYRGGRFDLLKYVDPQTGFISQKSYQGRDLKSLELPGLWNGAMSDWNTMFVEVPVETFNPVKTVLDLLRPAHA